MLDRVVHVHCKDARRDVLERARSTDGSFMQAVLDGVFTVPGDGFIDFPAILKILREAGYAGWLVCEAEQDPAKANPLDLCPDGLCQPRANGPSGRVHGEAMTMPMKRLDVGVLGGGLIVQVEHLPNLLNLPEHFRVVGVAEPSAKVRGHLERRWGVATFAAPEELLDRKLDAILIATPDSYHADLAVAALDRGLHVFSEKPLCYEVEDATRVAAARDRAGRVVQVGYMKRFDPSWRLLAEMIGGLGERLRLISVEVNDPDSWPYTAHRDYLAGDDVPAGLIEESGRRRDAQIARALGGTPGAAQIKGFAGSLQRKHGA